MFSPDAASASISAAIKCNHGGYSGFRDERFPSLFPQKQVYYVWLHTLATRENFLLAGSTGLTRGWTLSR